MGAGILLLFVSVCALLAFFVLPFQSPDALSANTAVFSIAAILVVYGALLLAIGRSLRGDRTSAYFYLPSPYLLLGAFFLTLIIGQIVLQINVGTAFLFPIWHVLTSLLFPLAILSFIARSAGRVSARSVLAQFIWGGLVTIVLTLVLELIIGGVLALLAMMGIALVLGPEALNEIASAFLRVPTDTERILQVVLQNPVSTVIAGGTAFFMIVVMVPLLEELLKAIGPGLLIRRRVRAAFLPTRGNVVLWGAAAGAGYAFTENMLNGQGALNNANTLFGMWSGAMVLRAGTSLMHMLATATVSVGLYEAMVAHKRGRLPLLLMVAVMAHAIWNTSALLLAGALSTELMNTPLSRFAPLPGILVLGLLAALFAGGLFWLRTLRQWARRLPDSTPT